MVPLARAVESGGHEAAFATAERFCRRVVEPTGFRSFPAGLSPLVVEDETMSLPEVAALDHGDVWRFGAHMFAGVAGPAKVAALVDAIDAWQPDLVVHDAIDFAAPVAAAHRRLPWAGHSFGALQPREFWDLAGDLVAPTWQEWKVEPRPAGGVFDHLYLDICPPGLQAPDIASVATAQAVRPVPFDTSGDEGLPDWVSSLPGRPTVYVTMGTVFNGTPGVFEAVLEGLGEAPFNVIVTVGRDRDPAELGAQPANVHVERWIPQTLLFPRCDVVVCHGGSGTVFAALAHGLPLLILPQGANQFWNAERGVELGVARALAEHDVDATAVRREVDELLGRPDHRLAAHRLRLEIEAMPAPAAVVPRLEELGRGEGPQPSPAAAAGDG
jgi:UDP:flavonoid glycosyltransferase YjiC (YdhE family)